MRRRPLISGLSLAALATSPSSGGRSEPGDACRAGPSGPARGAAGRPRRSRTSTAAIPRREFGPRDPRRVRWQCRCMPRWHGFDVGTTRGGSGRVRAEVDVPPGGAGRRTRATWQGSLSSGERGRGGGSHRRDVDVASSAPATARDSGRGMPATRSGPLRRRRARRLDSLRSSSTGAPPERR